MEQRCCVLVEQGDLHLTVSCQQAPRDCAKGTVVVVVVVVVEYLLGSLALKS